MSRKRKQTTATPSLGSASPNVHQSSPRSDLATPPARRLLPVPTGAHTPQSFCSNPLSVRSTQQPRAPLIANSPLADSPPSESSLPTSERTSGGVLSATSPRPLDDLVGTSYRSKPATTTDVADLAARFEASQISNQAQVRETPQLPSPADDQFTQLRDQIGSLSDELIATKTELAATKTELVATRTELAATRTELSVIKGRVMLLEAERAPLYLVGIMALLLVNQKGVMPVGIDHVLDVFKTARFIDPGEL